MAQHMLIQLHELWHRVEEALDRWKQHLDAVADSVDHDFGELSSKILDGQTKTAMLEANRDNFQARLDIVCYFHGTFGFGQTAEPVIETIARCLPRAIGNETAKSHFARALPYTGRYQYLQHKRLSDWEGEISSRFNFLRGKYVALCKLLEDGDRELEAAFQDKESIKRLLCFFEEERSHGATVDEATVKTLNVDLINVERVITYYEAQMQDFQAQVAWQVQIESTRQTLIGDYFFKEQ